MEDGEFAAESGIMDQRPKNEDAEVLVGSAAVEDAVAMEERQGAEEDASGRVRAQKKAAERSMPCRQGRFRL